MHRVGVSAGRDEPAATDMCKIAQALSEDDIDAISALNFYASLQ